MNKTIHDDEPDDVFHKEHLFLYFDYQHPCDSVPKFYGSTHVSPCMMIAALKGARTPADRAADNAYAFIMLFNIECFSLT